MRQLAALAVLLSLSGCQGGRDVGNTERDQAAVSPPLQAAVAQPPQGRWLAGDMHVHTDHSSDGSALRQGLDQRGPGNVSVAAQIRQGELNGLDWLPITDHRTYVQHYDPLWESSRLLLIPGEEANGSPHANPVGAIDTVVQGSVPEGRPRWSRLQTSIWDAHSQGAAWQHNHPDDGHLNDDLSLNENANAIGADLVEGWNSYSAIERQMEYCETQWNRGFRFGISGASDSHFRELWPIMAPGLPATRVFVPQASVRGVLEGLRAGRTTVTAGEWRAPRVFLQADFDGDGVFEAIAGDEIVAPPGTPGMLRIAVDNALPLLNRIHLYQAPGGRVAGPIKVLQVTRRQQSFDVAVEAPQQAGWFYVEVRGVGAPHSLDADARDDPSRLHFDQLLLDERRALSSPIFVGPQLATPQPDESLPPPITRDDGAANVLGQSQAYAGFPDIAVVGEVSHVVAEQHQAGASHVLYRRISAGDADTAINLVPASDTARFPKVAARGDDVWVAWQDERASQAPHRPAIYLRHSSDGGQSWQPEQLLRSLEGRAEMPDLALMPNGQPVVVWQEIAAGLAFDVMVQRVGQDDQPYNLSGPGKTVAAANLLDTRSARYPASVWPKVSVGPGGNIAVAFHDNRTDPDPNWTSQLFSGEDNSTEFDNWQVLVGVLRGEQWSDLSALGQDDRADRHADLTFTHQGDLVVVWDSKEMRGAGANTAIHSAISSNGGQSWSAEQRVAENPQMMSQYPRLANGPGGVLAAWYDNRATDWRWSVMSARLRDNQWGDGQLIAAPGNNTWPALDQDQIVFASTRRAQRLQRDQTQEIYLLPAQP